MNARARSATAIVSQIAIITAGQTGVFTGMLAPVSGPRALIRIVPFGIRIRSISKNFSMRGTSAEGMANFIRAAKMIA
jgi:hypothetical protein